MGDDFPVEKELRPTPRLSPYDNTSTLYDSYELQAVTRQINKAMHMQPSIGSSPPYPSYVKSAFYRHRLDCIYKQNEMTPKRIVCSTVTGETTGRKVSTRGNKSAIAGFITKLWNKVKQGLLLNKQKI